MRYAILGGSFNPVHAGHLFLADAVLSELKYDRVILIPTFISPLKIGAETASPQDRLEMLAASIPGDPRLTIDNCEIKREGVSYTIDTLKDIIARYRPEGKPGLILGDDLVPTFYKWRAPGEIAELADIIIARRLSEPPLFGAGPQSTPRHPGYDASFPAGDGGECLCATGGTGAGDENAPALSPGQVFPFPHKDLGNEIMNVSSRLVREKIRLNENWRYLVPAGARYIIEDRRLYDFSAGRESSAGGPAGITEIIVRLENDARALLTPSRFIHSRNVALEARDLCRRFGFDPQKGYLAGIAHDMCKSMGEAELVRLAHADGKSISKLERKKTGLLHARAAAVLLEKRYGVTDKDILEAVRCHTTGRADMGGLARVVYVADKIEISRTGLDPAFGELSRSADLDTLFKAVLDNTVAYLKSRQMDISYGTKRLLAAMHKKSKTKEYKL